MQTGTRGSTTWLFWERREHSGLAPPFCELGKGHTESGVRDTVPKESSYAVVLGRRRKGFSCVLDIFCCGVLLWSCRAQQQPVLLQGAASPQFQDLTFILVKCHEVGPFLQLLRSPWVAVLPWDMSLSFGEFGVSWRLDEGAHCLHFDITDKDI